MLTILPLLLAAAPVGDAVLVRAGTIHLVGDGTVLKDGALLIEDGKIANYQAVVPSTWNAGPRDPRGQMGPYEASLIGTPIANPEQPLEILRTIHSFDPCLACSTHVMSPDGEELAEVKVR